MKKQLFEILLKVMLYIGLLSIIINIFAFNGEPNALSWIAPGILFIPITHFGITEQ